MPARANARLLGRWSLLLLAAAGVLLALLLGFGDSDAVAGWAQRARGTAGAALAALLIIGTLGVIAARSIHARETARGERDHALAALARRGRELNVTIQSLQELVFRTDASGLITFSNQRFTALAGGPVTGRAFWDLVAPPQREEARALFGNARSQEARRLQAAMPADDSPARRFDIAVMPLQEGGRTVGFAGSAVDVTERVLAQQRVQDQLAFTRLLMEVSPLPCMVMDLQRRCVLVNRAWENMTGLPRAEVAGRPVNAHLPEAERELHAMHDARLLQHGAPLRYEAVVRHRDGTPRDVVVDKLLIPGDGGQPAGVLSVMIDVTEFRDAERATRQARDAAEEASRAKTEFIANISHELRTPLQSIIGFSELGHTRAAEQTRLATMFKDIHDAGQRMLALVNDLLDVAKIESTVGTIHLERCDLRGLLHEVLNELRPQLAGQGVRVALQLPETPLRGKVDPLRLQQVLRNMLANAIRFSPAGGTIQVTGEHTAADELHLSVADQGPGIPQDELESIFEAFVQSSQTKDGSGGTGLGLAICRKIVEVHGGRIRAENRPEGGAVFHLHLPARGTGETLPVPL